MIILDANILLYAYDLKAVLHQEARSWLFEVLSGDAPVGLPWQSVAAFLRLMTNPHLPGQRFTSHEALNFVESWLAQPNVRLLSPGDMHWSILKRMIIGGQVRGPMITDAQLAAITLEYGGVLHTTDRDFARFPDLRWKNPLA